MLLDIAKNSKDILKPFGFLDTLLYYSIVSEELKKFLKNKEIATKTHITSTIFFLKRGSKDEPIFIEEIPKAVTKKFLELRKFDLKNAREKLTKQEQKVWSYFVPRKLINLFYATNNEGQGKDIERIFFDIDRSNLSQKSTQKVALALVEEIQQDQDFNKKFKFEIFPMYTGSSFHVYLLLKNKISNSIYNKEISFSKDSPLESFTGRFCNNIKEKTKINVSGGHEKKSNFINIDPSQTPSGKLARAPFSLHMKSPNEVNGIAIPLSINDLKDKNLINKLKSYTPEKVIKDLNNLSKKLP